MTRLGLLATTALLLPALTACSAGSSGAGEEPRQPENTVQSALAVLPAETELVRFVDRGLVARRLGVDGVTSLGERSQARAYAAASRKAEWGATEIGFHAAVMSERGAFSELDVTWAARGVVTTEEGFDGWSVFALEDSVDLDRVADAMVAAGYSESEVDGHRHLTAPAPRRGGLVGGAYPWAVLREVTVVPDRQLLVTGDPGPVLDVLGARAESAYDAGGFAEVTAQLPSVEYAELRSAAAIDCAAPIRGNGEPTPVQVTAIQAALGMTGLGRPRTTALFVAGEDRPRAVTMLEFADAEAARADAAARAVWLTQGLDIVTRLRNGTLYTIRSQVADGSLVTVEWTYGSNLAAAVRAHQAGAGVAACVG